MRKIPTLFKRNPEDMKHVLDEVNPGCEWVLAGEGVATRKYDGTCCMLDGDGRWWARREVKRGKIPPADFRAVDHDETTGKTVGWVPVEQSGFAKWHGDALEREADGARFNPGTYELCGPKVQSNPEGFEHHVLVEHANADVLNVLDLTFAGIRTAVLSHSGEGIVWHHPDGRMAKLKTRDFPREAVATAFNETES